MFSQCQSGFAVDSLLCSCFKKHSGRWADYSTASQPRSIASSHSKMIWILLENQQTYPESVTFDQNWLWSHITSSTCIIFMKSFLFRKYFRFVLGCFCRKLLHINTPKKGKWYCWSFGCQASYYTRATYYAGDPVTHVSTVYSETVYTKRSCINLSDM